MCCYKVPPCYISFVPEPAPSVIDFRVLGPYPSCLTLKVLGSLPWTFASWVLGSRALAMWLKKVSWTLLHSSLFPFNALAPPLLLCKAPILLTSTVINRCKCASKQQSQLRMDSSAFSVVQLYECIKHSNAHAFLSSRRPLQIDHRVSYKPS